LVSVAGVLVSAAGAEGFAMAGPCANVSGDDANVAEISINGWHIAASVGKVGIGQGMIRFAAVWGSIADRFRGRTFRGRTFQGRTFQGRTFRRDRPADCTVTQRMRSTSEGKLDRSRGRRSKGAKKSRFRRTGQVTWPDRRSPSDVTQPKEPNRKGPTEGA
jgi:hypothetical protein